ncbi:MAG TPA: HlyD family efflux transporter periplasmic adaptor subunit [Blastocatellia bacterium]|nr:HlyD family efflux transporter periplasmic adaptor subunit [Blastocatellia bacterium]
MDIQRKNVKTKKRVRRAIYITVGVVLLAGITVAVTRLKPAAPTVEWGVLWPDTVKRGPMVRNVRGLGTLVPEEIRWIPAVTQGRVEIIRAHPGDPVKADTVILELSNPETEQAAVDADSQLKQAEANLAKLKVQLVSDKLTQESAAAQVKSQYLQAKLQKDTNEQLAKDKLISDLQNTQSKMQADELENRNRIEQERLKIFDENIKAQIAVQEAQVDSLRANAALKHKELESLRVKAGEDGVCQVVPVEVGQQVQPGTNLARVTDPRKLKAQIQIAETQIKDVALGQPAEIDTRNGIVNGSVSRIAPSSQNGTFTVDVTLQGELPKGAKDNLSVDGTIELEHLNDVVSVGRPVHGQENSTISLFKISKDQTEAVRVQVKLGVSSVSSVQILEGLNPGDQVILSDMSQYDAVDRIRISH